LQKPNEKAVGIDGRRNNSKKRTMKTNNKVFIATSLDGYIADKEGNIDWLHETPNPEHNDMGYANFMQTIDALVMGRTTFETVCAFDMEWPYEKPVFVLSNSLTEVPEDLVGKVFLVSGELTGILKEIHEKGYKNLYIDGGTTIQNFLKEELIDEMVITRFPILLGGGHRLFTELPTRIDFEVIKSEVFLNQLVQTHYRRKK
jgi:dihydrofolate reductase